MPGYARDVCYKLRLDGWAIYPTGSRYICPGHARPDSDWDVMVMGDELCGNSPLHKAFPPGMRNEGSNESLRFDALNLIYLEPIMFSAWIKATRFCLDNPAAIDRDYRVRIFKMHQEQEIHSQLDAIMDNRGAMPTAKRPPSSKIPWTTRATSVAQHLQP